jgi:hypothetical protein
MKVGGFFIGAEAVLRNAATLGCERYGLGYVNNHRKPQYHGLSVCLFQKSFAP